MKLPKILWHFLVVISLGILLAGYAALLLALVGCAARPRPHVYNDTCDLCITVPRQAPHKPAPRPRPAPKAAPRGR